MSLALQAVLGLSALWLLYIYFGYPVILFLVAGRRVPRRPDPSYRPMISILISAFNEEDAIGATVANKLELDYPPERYEILVISDGSTDGTDRIVESLARTHPGRVRLIRQTPRQGKTAALNRAATAARGEILVFADANSLYDSQALGNLVANFADESVGYVTGKMIYTNPDGSITGDGCTVYMRYENLLREMETRLGSIVGVDGGIDAVRRSLFQAMRADQLPDLVLPLRVAERGYRVVFEPRAVLREQALGSAEEEYRMRVRVTLRALWALHDLHHLFNPFRYPRYSWQLVSHKLLRYLAFLPQTLLLVTNALLVGEGGGFRSLFLVQAAFYLLVGAGFVMDKLGIRFPVTLIPYYVSLLNVSCGHAFLKYLRGHRQVLWQPRGG